MEATWLGGPWDGRTDELPPGTHSVSVAIADKPPGYVEVRCYVVNTDHGWLIVWHEP